MPITTFRRNILFSAFLPTVVFAVITLRSIAVTGFQLRPILSARRAFTFHPSSQLQHDKSENRQNVDSERQLRLEVSNEYFITDALFVHLSPAAQILTEAFYSHRTNFITFQIEKLKTVLSLESTFDKQRLNPMGQMFVACSSQNGKVLGFAEVDTCSLKKDCNEVKECGLDDAEKSNLPRPYMYNLAVDQRWKRKGIATALVAACEEFVRNMKPNNNDDAIMAYTRMGYSDASLASACNQLVSNNEEDEDKWIYLRVRKCNDAAILFYERIGYCKIDPQSIALTKEDVNSNSAEDGELILMGKQLTR